jgi:two-component system, LytTR family, sensor histidine kinase AlgZ
MRIRLFTRRPTLRQLPLAILKVALVGALLGPPCSLVIGWLGNAPWQQIFAHPWFWLGSSCLIGAIFGVAFYVTCGLPIDYLKPLIEEFPAAAARTVILLTAMAGGSLGWVIAILSVTWIFDAKLSTPLSLGKMAIVDGVLAAIVSLVISAFTKLQADKQLKERTLSEAAAKAQTFALQAQINPHFFFNTLNTISALIPIDPRAAQQTIGQLADMFRYTLSCSRAELVSLDDELAFAKNYLALERARFGNRLHVELPEPGCGAGVLLPGLTLQPIVENAVKYGIARRMEGGTVRLEIERNNGRCQLTVFNQFDSADGMPKLDEATVFRSGHALANIRERLKLVFGARAAFDMSVNGSEWVRVTVSVPVES